MRDGSAGQPPPAAEVNDWWQTHEGKDAFEQLSQWPMGNLIGNGLLAEETWVGIPVFILLRYARATACLARQIA